MRFKITLLLLAFLIFAGNASSYAGAGENDKKKSAISENGTIQCNSEIPIPLTAGSFDNLTAGSSTSGLCLLGCGISNVSRLTDVNQSNYATATTALGVGVTHRLRVTDSNDVFAAGNFAGFRIAPNGGLLSLDLLNNISIRTYQSGVVKETVTGGSLISVSLLASPGNFIVGFNTTQSFDAVEISINSLAGVTTSTNIFYAVIRNYCAGVSLSCNAPTAINLPAFPAAIQNAHTGVSGISVGNITNPEDAISASVSDYAGLNLLAGVAGSASIAIKDQITDYPAGTYAGFEIENVNLASVGALGNVQIKTYLNGAARQQFSGSNLLVNGTLLNASGRYKLGFVATLSFDEVQISVNQIVGVNLGLTKVYSAIFQKFCPGPELPCNTPTAINAPTYPVFINGIRTGIDGIACVLCSVSDTEKLIDANPSNHANIDLTASVGIRGQISVKDQLTDYPAGTFAGFDIESVGLLNVNAFDAIRVITYLDGVQQESKTGFGPLISVNTGLLISKERQTIGFVAALPFDEAQISLTNLANVILGTVKVHNAFIERFCPAVVECNETYALTNPAFPVVAKSGLSGLACVACAVNNTNNVLTANPSDYANISLTASALVSGSIAVADQLFTYPPGTRAGFTIKDINNLIELDLFQSLTVSTYNNGQLRESKTGAQLLSLSLIAPIFGSGPGFYNVGFKATLSFDEIKITVGSLASVISNVNVYGAFVNTKDSDDGGGPLSCNASDLSIVKTVSNANPPVGSNVTFTIVAANGGPRDADGVVVTDVLPTGYTYISTAVSTGSYNNATGIWTIGTLNNGANAILTITATVNAVGIFANTATITGNQPDPNLENNTSTSTPSPVNVIIANDDASAPINGYAGGTFTNVLGNDTLNGNPVLASQVNTTFVTATHPGITLSGTNVNVAPGTPAGSYTLTYQICEKASPANCDQAVVSLTVTAPVIDAVNDTAAPINGYTGGTFSNVLGNDTLNGQHVLASQVNTTFVSSTHSGITLSGTNVNVAPGTPAGSYSLTYQICEKVNPTNCDQAVVSITVTAPNINAVNDTAAPINGYTGGTFTNVLGNDTLNGQPVLASQVNTTLVSSPNPGITLSGTNVNIAPGTPAGSYTLTYQICEKVNPANCDQADVSITVTAPAIDAVNDIAAPINGYTGGTFTNVLGNDTLNGQPVLASQVNTTLVSSPNPGITLSGTNVNVAAGTPAGSYTLTYQICEKVNPTNCDQANVSITVTAPAIDAVNDTGTPVNNATGGTAFSNVLVNDTLNGQPVQASQVNTSFVSSTHQGITLSGTNVIVAQGTPPGSYTLTYQICEKVNPTNCDQAMVSVSVVCPQTAGPSVSITQPNCLTATGTITVTAPIGSGFSYSINGSNYQNNTAFSNLQSGSYNVTVKNSSGCVSSATVAVINQQPQTPVAPTVSVSQPSCSVETGTITVTAPLGSGLTYSIDWVNYQASTVFPNLETNGYNVSVKNSSGCISTATYVEINKPPRPTAAPTITVIQPNCSVGTGSITITAPLGSDLSYSINGSTYQSGTTFANLAPNSYSVTVKNSNGGCISAATVAVITAPPASPAAPTVSVTQPTCAVATGTITVTAPTGSGLTYSINGTNYQSSTVFGGLPSGSYNVTVKNSSGCISSATSATIIAQPSGPAAPTVSITHPSCTVATGTITVTSPTGSGFTYSLNNMAFQSNPVFSGLIAGSYSIKVKNSLGCVSEATLAVINKEPGTPSAPTVAVTQPTCSVATGSITITAPIAPGLTYSINGSNYVSGTIFSGLQPGSYNVTVKNSSGCISAATVAVINAQPVPPAQPTVSVSHPSCSSATGTITVTAPLGSGLTYSINGSNYQSSNIFSGLTPGSYNVTVKNSSGCVSAVRVAVINGQPSSCNAPGIFHTSVNCAAYSNDSSSQLIGQLCYSTRSNKVANVTPGQFFYFTSLTAPSASFCVDIVQTKSNSGLALFSIQQGNQLTLYNGGCSNLATGTQVSVGQGRICISNATPGAQYILSVKYDSKSVVGSTFTGSAPIVQYTFESKINGATLPNSTASVNLVPNCTTRVENPLQGDMKVTLAPNPSPHEFEVQIESLSKENIVIRVSDANGRFLKEIKANYADSIRLGNELSRGMYFIEVIQGNSRQVLRALKL